MKGIHISIFFARKHVGLNNSIKDSPPLHFQASVIANEKMVPPKRLLKPNTTPAYHLTVYPRRTTAAALNQ
jgi:hypothetical protein